MKNAVIVACIVLLAIQSTLVDAGGKKKDKRIATQQQLVAINQILERDGLEKCKEFIKKYGKPKDEIKKSCKKLNKFYKMLDDHDCSQSVRQEISNVLGCDQVGNNAEYQAQKDDATVTTATTNVTTAGTTITTTKGSQTGSNVTKAKA